WARTRSTAPTRRKPQRRKSRSSSPATRSWGEGRSRLADARERRRLKDRVGDVGHDWPVLLGLVSRRNPFGITDEGAPLPLSLVERFPRQKISQLLVRFADHRRPEPGLPDAVLLPYAERLRFEPLQQSRQPVGNAAIDAKLINHRETP